MIIGMFAGCIAAALWANNNIKLRQPQHRIRIARCWAAIIAGFGARPGDGCNPGGVLHRYSSVFAARPGSSRWRPPRVRTSAPNSTLLPMFRIPVKLQKVKAAAPLTQKPEQARRRFRLGMAVFGPRWPWSLDDAFDAPKLGIAMLFGIGFGLLIERARICFTSAFRDLWITGRTHMAKAIIGMAVSAIGIFQLRAAWRGAEDHVGRPECGAARCCCSASASCWPAVARPAGWYARWKGRCTTGRVGQYHRRHAAGLLLGRSGASAGDRLRQDQPARHLRPNWWPGGDLSAALAFAAMLWWGLFPRPA